MTDREYLELAAKAAGMKIYESTDGTIQNRPVWVFRAGGGMGTMPYEEQWNPLREDAQALRLAVKLGLLISHSAYKPGENAYGFIGIAWYGQRVEFKPEKFTDDPYAATRRAIVRAAAEIGRSMK